MNQALILFFFFFFFFNKESSFTWFILSPQLKHNFWAIIFSFHLNTAYTQPARIFPLLESLFYFLQTR